MGGREEEWWSCQKRPSVPWLLTRIVASGKHITWENVSGVQKYSSRTLRKIITCYKYEPKKVNMKSKPDWIHITSSTVGKSSCTSVEPLRWCGSKKWNNGTGSWHRCTRSCLRRRRLWGGEWQRGNKYYSTSLPLVSGNNIWRNFRWSSFVAMAM